ncbi:Oxoglutarate and iron-dependent oxygenase degradation C-term-domain-containing protein [Panaeolus papilionaceus]|nr:Oxoglutarate and iron-dependent oxygenase degradation C-term-domain-containing protein [Panaeolus papilionaceus]
MARTRDRSPKPDSPTKRQKLNVQKSLPSAPDPTTLFANNLFDHNNIARLNADYQNSQPFNYAVVEKLFQDDLLRNVKDECLADLNFTEKETDIYKVNQTGDLASLNYLSANEISKLPNLLQLRNALYSKQFREFLQAVTGCGPLSGTKQDMSVNSYTRGCHLLNHDDVIGTRRVSYILYMPLPHYQLWQKDWGGALELYPVKLSEDGQPEPEAVPSKSIPPSWNQFILFQVQPGQSFHSVEEVVVGGEGEDGRERLSISGWFHAPQEGEEGYSLEPANTEVKSSREQLTSTSTSFTPYPDAEESSPDGITDDKIPLSDEHVAFLSEFLNPVYLTLRTMKALATRFVQESSLELHSFLNNELAAALEPRLRERDQRDGLGANRAGRIPPHDAGVSPSTLPPFFQSASSSTTKGVSPPSTPALAGIVMPTVPVAPFPEASAYCIKGPPHKYRYTVLLPEDQYSDPSSMSTHAGSPSSSGTASAPPKRIIRAVTPRAHVYATTPRGDPSQLLRMLQDELFPSAAFRAWLGKVSRLVPMGHSVEARRFRPGLDYRLATYEEREARLDVVLGLTPGVVEDDDDGDMESGSDAGSGSDRALGGGGWIPEWGGWECYMAPHNEEDDPAVYRSSSQKKLSKPSSNGDVNGRTSSSKPNSSINGDGSVNGMEKDEPAPDSEDENMGEEEDSTLLTVQPGFNRLLLVLRDERVMRFVKYVSAAAVGSRWDVCGEYEVGLVQEDGDDLSD